MLFLGTASFWEWLLITLIVIALAFVYRGTLQRQLQTGAPPSVGALVLPAIILAGVSLRATPTGDEPHYLIMTQSVLREGDFDLRNNYERMDYLAYYPDMIPDPHVTVVGNAWYPVHEIGLPILVAPLFAVAGRPGVVMMLSLMTVVGIRVLWSLLRRAGFAPKTTVITTLVAGFSLPLISLSGQIFPEVPAFLIVSMALWVILAPAPTGWSWAALVGGLAFLPWLHPKYMALAIALLSSAALTHHQRAARPALAAAGGSLFISIAGSMFHSHQWYGVALPGTPILTPQAPIAQDWLTTLAAHFFVEPGVGLLGTLFDQQSGLFFASPVYVLAIPGIVMLWRRRRSWAIACGVIFASVYLPAGAFGVWHGGFSSPARLLTPVVPVLALGIASALDAGGQRAWKLFGLLAVPSLLHAYLVTALPSFTRYGDPVSQHNYFIALFERLTRLDLTLLFPTFRNSVSTTWLTLSVYLLAIIAIAILLIRQNATERVYQT